MNSLLPSKESVESWHRSVEKQARSLLLLRGPAVNYRAQKTSSDLHLACATGIEMGVPIQTFRSTEK